MKLKFANIPQATAAVLAMLALALPQVAVADEDTGTGGATISGSAVDVTGNAAAFQKRHQVSADGYGGIENYSFEKTYGDGVFSVDGKAIFGNEDYNLVLRYIKGDKYTVEAGYRQFRVWYDSTGSVLPQVESNSSLMAITRLYGTDGFAIDRKSFWLDGLFNVTPNFSFHLRYEHNIRTGQKDTTSQADTNLTSGLGTRNVVPAYYDIDETQDLFIADATLHNDKGEITGAVRWDNRTVNDARNMSRRPGEAGVNRSITQIDDTDSDMFNAHAFARYEYTDKLSLNAAYSHTKVDTVIGGSRIVGSDFYSDWNPTFANRQQRDEGFFDLSGGSETRINVANVNLTYVPTETFVVVPSFRVERDTRSIDTDFEETNFTSARVATVEEAAVLSHNKWDEWAFQLESRYTGAKQWVFIGTASWTKGDGNISESEYVEGDLDLFRDSDLTRWTEKYALTANWYPHPKVNFSFIYSYLDRYNDYDRVDASSAPTGGDRYPAYMKSLDLKTNAFTARMTLRPTTMVNLVSRVDVKKTDLEGNELGLDLIQAGKYDTLVVSQSVNWNPRNNIFVQGMINYIEDSLHTPANDVTGAGANLVQEQVNDYWSATATVGFVVDEQDSIFLSYDYFFADNFVDNSSVSVPYGLNRRDYTASLTWTRKLGEKLDLSFRYAYAKNVENSSFGLDDYKANLFYGKLDYRF